jgi:hypothetical protein
MTDIAPPFVVKSSKSIKWHGEEDDTQQPGADGHNEARFFIHPSWISQRPRDEQITSREKIDSQKRTEVQHQLKSTANCPDCHF